MKAGCGGCPNRSRRTPNYISAPLCSAESTSLSVAEVTARQRIESLAEVLALRFGSGRVASFYCRASVSPDGRTVAISRGNFATYTVTTAGALDHVPGTPFPFGLATALDFSPLGGLLATTQLNTGGGSGELVTLYSVSPGGVPDPKPVSSVVAGLGMEAVEFSSDGRLLAALSYSGSTHAIWMYQVDEGGALTQVAGDPFKTPVGSNEIALSSVGSLLAITDELKPRIFVFAIRPDGTIRQVEVLTIPGAPDLGPGSIAFSPTEHKLIVINSSRKSLSAYNYR